MKLTRTKPTKSLSGNRIRGYIPVQLKLSAQAIKELEIYTDHLNVSLSWLVMKLILNELVENRVLYNELAGGAKLC